MFRRCSKRPNRHSKASASASSSLAGHHDDPNSNIADPHACGYIIVPPPPRPHQCVLDNMLCNTSIELEKLGEQDPGRFTEEDIINAMFAIGHYYNPRKAALFLLTCDELSMLDIDPNYFTLEEINAAMNRYAIFSSDIPRARVVAVAQYLQKFAAQSLTPHDNASANDMATEKIASGVVKRSSTSMQLPPPHHHVHGLAPTGEDSLGNTTPLGRSLHPMPRRSRKHTSHVDGAINDDKSDDCGDENFHTNTPQSVRLASRKRSTLMNDEDIGSTTTPVTKKRLVFDSVSKDYTDSSNPSTSLNTMSVTNAIDATREELVRMNVQHGRVFPKSGIEMALKASNSDPRMAALFLHNAGKSKDSAKEPSPTVIGNTIASEIHSSSYMLKSLSNLEPSNGKYSYGLGMPTKKGTHYFHLNPGEAKWTAEEKSAAAMVAKGLPHHDNFEGETTLEKRFKRAASQGDCPNAELVRCEPDPNASNRGEELGYLAKCPECGKEFNCLQTYSTSKGVIFDSLKFRMHKRTCGKEVCGCGLDLDEIVALFESNYEGPRAFQAAASAHFGVCKTDQDVIFDILDGYTKMKNSMIDVLTGKTDDEKEKLRKRYVLPSQYGLDTMMKKLEVPCEERKAWKTKFPNKDCDLVYNWIAGRRKGDYWTTEETKKKMNSYGIDVTKVVVWKRSGVDS